MKDEKALLDDKDRRILFELDENSRIFETSLSKKLRLSREIVKYRINKLEKQGIIKNFDAIVNPAKLGYIIYKVYLKLQNLSKETEQKILMYLEKNNSIFWIARCDGFFDLIFGAYVKQISEFDTLFRDFMGHFSKNILSKNISNSVYVDIYRRGYLANKKSLPVKWGGEIENFDLDNLETAILKLIASNSRIPVAEICEKLNSTPKTVISKIKELENKGVILGYRLNLNLNQIGMGYFKALIYFQNISPEKEVGFRKFCEENKNICYYIKSIGEWDAELDIEIENFEKLNMLIREIKEQFGDIIQTVYSLFIYEERKGDLNIVQNLK